MQNPFNKFLSYETPASKVFIPLLLFVFCFLLRLLYISRQDICIDEPFSIYHAQFSVSEIICYLKPTNNPPLFEILLHYWIKIFGISAFSVRFLPAFFSSLAVIYIYKSGTRFFSPVIGLTASLLYIFSTHSVYYAHDCRVYSLFLFLTAASLYFGAKLISGNSNKRDLIIFCIMNALMVYSHYFGFIVWFTEFVLLCACARQHLKKIILIFGAAAMLYAPQFFYLINRFIFSSSQGTWVKEPNGIEAIYNLLWSFSNMPLTTVVCLMVLLVSLILFFVRKEKINKVKAFFVASFFIPFLLMFFVSYKIPVFNARYLTFLLPAYYITISTLAFDVVRKEKFKIVFPLLIIVLFGFTVNFNPDKKREAKATVEFINKVKQPSSLVVICTHEFLTNYAYYTDEKLFRMTGTDEYSELEKELKRRNIYAVRSINEVDADAVKNAGNVIYLDAGADFSNPGNNVLITLTQRFSLKNKTHFKEIFDVYEFNNKP